jgi:hypothetical protein
MAFYLDKRSSRTTWLKVRQVSPGGNPAWLHTSGWLTQTSPLSAQPGGLGRDDVDYTGEDLLLLQKDSEIKRLRSLLGGARAVKGVSQVLSSLMYAVCAG